jgi:hypothetical protein
MPTPGIPQSPTLSRYSECSEDSLAASKLLNDALFQPLEEAAVLVAVRHARGDAYWPSKTLDELNIGHGAKGLDRLRHSPFNFGNSRVSARDNDM